MASRSAAVSAASSPVPARSDSGGASFGASRSRALGGRWDSSSAARRRSTGRRGALHGELGPVEDAALDEAVELHPVVDRGVLDPATEGRLLRVGERHEARPVAVLGDDHRARPIGAEEGAQLVAAHRRDQPTPHREVEVVDPRGAGVPGDAQQVVHPHPEARDVGAHQLLEHVAGALRTSITRHGKARQLGVGHRLHQRLEGEEALRVEQPQLRVDDGRRGEAQGDAKALRRGRRGPLRGARLEAGLEHVVDAPLLGVGVDEVPGPSASTRALRRCARREREPSAASGCSYPKATQRSPSPTRT
jgi:hypothetical protein